MFMNSFWIKAPRGFHLQAAEDGKQVVENHYVAVDRHETQQPGGADEQQEEEGHTQRRTELKSVNSRVTRRTECDDMWAM